MTMRDVDNFMRKNRFVEIIHIDKIITMIEVYAFPPSKFLISFFHWETDQSRQEKINDLVKVYRIKRGEKLVLPPKI